jgi:pimeloyl-ACP methyl ester carboxylesterase
LVTEREHLAPEEAKAVGVQMATSKFVDLNGLKFHYLDYGSEGRPYLVLLHGLNGNAHAFDVVAPHLTASHYVVALDFRGHGDSQWGPPKAIRRRTISAISARS